MCRLKIGRESLKKHRFDLTEMDTITNQDNLDNIINTNNDDYYNSDNLNDHLIPLLAELMQEQLKQTCDRKDS